MKRACGQWVGREDSSRSRLPCYVKALAATVAAYALSPIDLIPDFIPVLGYVDEPRRSRRDSCLMVIRARGRGLVMASILASRYRLVSRLWTSQI